MAFVSFFNIIVPFGVIIAALLRVMCEGDQKQYK